MQRAKRKTTSGSTTPVKITASLQHELPGHEQKATWFRLADSFRSVYNSMPPDPLEQITPWWADFTRKLEAAFLPTPPHGFLNDPTIRWTMFPPWSEYTPRELSYVRAVFGEDTTRAMIRENDIGAPPMFMDGDIPSSGNIVHHCYHLARYFDKTGVRPKDIRVVVEYGGGYGSTARLWRRIAPNTTYISIDTRIMCAVQWLYLSSIYGEGAAVVHGAGDGPIQLVKGAYNIVPCGAMARIPACADLFIAEWSISESTAASQAVVADSNLFGAKHALIGHQQTVSIFPCADAFSKQIAKRVKFAEHIEDTLGFLPGNFYAFF